MTPRFCSSVVALAIAGGWVLPAHAAPSSMDAVLEEMRAMRSEMGRMAERITALEGELNEARAAASQASAQAEAANQAASNATALAREVKDNPPVKVAWKGGPELSDGREGGWSFKPRGRIQVDVGSINAPSGLAGNGNSQLGTRMKFRRAFIGVDGTIPGGFGYRFEADVAGSNVVLTDLYLTYKPTSAITLTVGQQKPFWGLEEMTSDLFTSHMERASFASAFGFERRVGASAQYTGKSFIVQGGVFADDAASLNDDRNRNWSVDGRIVFMPKLAGGTLHLGVSAHYNSLGGSNTTARYRARPWVRSTDLRFIDTGTFAANSERLLGLEAAYVSGPFHATVESSWMTVSRPGFADPTFQGGYAEVGYIITGEKTAYKAGVYDRIKPANPLGKGGIGAFQVNARYDWLDLNDAGIVGGTQNAYGLSAIWIPVDYVRFIMTYGHTKYSNAARATATGDRSYGVDAYGLRAQFDF